jgi:hypothetical protein
MIVVSAVAIIIFLAHLGLAAAVVQLFKRWRR